MAKKLSWASLRPHVPTLAVAAALALRLPALQRSMYVDELATWSLLHAPSLAAAVAELRADTHHPGYFGLLYLWARVSDHTLWLRLLSLLFDAGTLLLLRRQLGRLSAASACLGVALWGLCPIALRNATEMRPYAALTCCTVWAFVSAQALLEARDARRWRPQLQGCLAFAAVVAMHPVGYMVAVAICGGWVLASLLGASPAALADPVPGMPALPAAAKRARLTSLLGPLLVASGLFALLHYKFALDPSGSRISWMPGMSFGLLCRIFNFCYGTDGLSVYSLLHRLGDSEGPLGTTFFAASLAIGLAHRRTRSWAATALLYAAIVIVYSVLGRPIFWHRSIVPAIGLAAGALAGALPRRPRPLAYLLLGPCLLWQLGVWLPRAGRAVDPSEDAGRALVAQMQPGDAIVVSPDFMHIAVEPALQQRAATEVLSFAAAAQAKAPRAVSVLIRGDLVNGEPDLRAAPQIQALHDAGVVAHDWFIFLDENDDWHAPSAQRRTELFKTIDAIYGPCQTVAPEARVAHVHCAPGAARG